MQNRVFFTGKSVQAGKQAKTEQNIGKIIKIHHLGTVNQKKKKENLKKKNHQKKSKLRAKIISTKVYRIILHYGFKH